MKKYKANLRIEGSKVISYVTHVATIEGGKLIQLGYRQTRPRAGAILSRGGSLVRVTEQNGLESVSSWLISEAERSPSG